MELINAGNSVINLYLIPNGDEYVLVDTGYYFNYKGFMKKLKKLNIDVKQITYVIITHIHADHVGFLAELLKLTPATLIYCTDDKERLEGGKNNENVYIAGFAQFLASKLSIAFRKYTQFFPPVVYDKVLDPSEARIGGLDLRFLKLKGHTSNDLAVIIDDKILCGDICMNGSGSTNHSPMWIEDNDSLCDSWVKLLEEGDHVLYPAHGKPFSVLALNKCLPKQRDRKLYKLKKQPY